LLGAARGFTARQEERSETSMQDPAPGRAITGIAGLDDILHGGLIAGRLYLIDGNPGSGKTTLALQFLLEGVRLGERCMYVTLSETREELKSNAASHGWSLEALDIFQLSVAERDANGDGELTMLHPSEVELGEATRRILDAIERVRPARMVLDSLSELRLLSQSSLRYRRQILALKQFFDGRGCTVLLLDDRTTEGPDRQLQSIAHGVISLEQRAPSYGRALRQIQVVKFRGSDFRSGYHHMRLRAGGIQVYPRLAAVEHSRDFDLSHLASGVPPLDRLLGGGIDVGSSTLLAGPSGAGKSTIALQYALAAAQRGEHAVVFSFDESRTTLTTRLAAMGMRFDEGRGAGQIAVNQVDPAEVTPGEFAHLVREAVERDRARVIIIDSLNGYVNAMVDSQYLTAQLHELLAYLGNQGVSSFLIAGQTGLLTGLMGTPGDASYLADTIIFLRYFEHNGKVRKAISVLKKRSGAHEDSIRELQFDALGVHLSDPLVSLQGVLTGVPVERPAERGTVEYPHR
jgi:circadian clock protein KaiC